MQACLGALCVWLACRHCCVRQRHASNHDAWLALVAIQLCWLVMAAGAKQAEERLRASVLLELAACYVSVLS